MAVLVELLRGLQMVFADVELGRRQHGRQQNRRYKRQTEPQPVPTDKTGAAAVSGDQHFAALQLSPLLRPRLIAALRRRSALLGPRALLGWRWSMLLGWQLNCHPRHGLSRCQGEEIFDVAERCVGCWPSAMPVRASAPVPHTGGGRERQQRRKAGGPHPAELPEQPRRQRPRAQQVQADGHREHGGFQTRQSAGDAKQRKQQPAQRGGPSKNEPGRQQEHRPIVQTELGRRAEPVARQPFLRPQRRRTDQCAAPPCLRRAGQARQQRHVEEERVGRQSDKNRRISQLFHGYSLSESSKS